MKKIPITPAAIRKYRKAPYKLSYAAIGRLPQFGVSRQRIGQILNPKKPQPQLHSRSKRWTKVPCHTCGSDIRVVLSVAKTRKFCNWTCRWGHPLTTAKRKPTLSK